MKLTRKQLLLLQQFNQPETHLVISRWPSSAKASQKKTSRYDGIATYTQDTVTRFAKKYSALFIVLAERTDAGESVIELVQQNVLVIRAFDERHFHIYPQILVWLKQFGKVNKVYVHSEFCASGGPVLRFLVLPFLALIKLSGRHITFYAHNVVKSLSGYEEHLGVTGKTWEMKLLSAGYRWYFRGLSLLVDVFVVLELVVAERLRALTFQRPVLVEPHWIAAAHLRITPAEAKRRLGISPSTKLVLSFGFVTHYKGADFVAGFAKWLNRRSKYTNYQVVLAGGEAYSLKNKEYYQKYYSELVALAAQLPNLTLTGFLSEREVALWLTAADVVVLPYRNLMGGSGALQQALRFNKPVLLSRVMGEALGISDTEVLFEHSNVSLAHRLHGFFESTAKRREIVDFARRYAAALRLDCLLPQHFSEVYAQPTQSEKQSSKLIEWGRKVYCAVAENKA
jgi:glycosyltransferase involved in cell wall biosynthesis